MIVPEDGTPFRAPGKADDKLEDAPPDLRPGGFAVPVWGPVAAGPRLAEWRSPLTRRLGSASIRVEMGCGAIGSTSDSGSEGSRFES